MPLIIKVAFVSSKKEKLLSETFYTKKEGVSSYIQYRVFSWLVENRRFYLKDGKYLNVSLPSSDIVDIVLTIHQTQLGGSYLVPLKEFL